MSEKHKKEEHHEEEHHGHAKPAKMSAFEGFQYGFICGVGVTIYVVLNWASIAAWIKERVSQ